MNFVPNHPIDSSFFYVEFVQFFYWNGWKYRQYQIYKYSYE